MKKILMLLFLVFSSIALVACGDNVKLEWVTMPDSVYQIGEMEEDDFNNTVSVKIGEDTYTIAEALEDFPEDFKIVSPFNASSKGDKVFTVKYKTLTLNFNYKVVDAETPVVDTIAPTYDWYVGKTSPYTLSSIGDLYGFANIVNGKASSVGQDSFADKTVKLAVDIDLSNQVWEPIGASPRMNNIQLEVLVDQVTHPTTEGKLYKFSDGKYYVTYKDHAGVVKSKEKSIATLADYSENKEVNGLYFVDSYFYADKKAGANGNTINDFDFYYSNDVPVGNFFQGTFDGQGHKITGLSDIGYTPTVVFEYANSAMIVTGYTFGLFGVVKNNVTIKNLTFEDVAVVGAYYDTNIKDIVLAEIDSVGAAIGYAFGDGNLTIDNVKVLSGSITASNAASGIVGRFYNTGETLIQNCENRATISLSGNGTHAGGIAGYTTYNTKLQFINNTNYGNITAHNKANQAGAIINYDGAKKAEFINCRNFGNIIGTAHITGDGAGITSRASGHTFTNCVNYGILTQKTA